MSLPCAGLSRQQTRTHIRMFSRLLNFQSEASSPEPITTTINHGSPVGSELELPPDFDSASDVVTASNGAIGLIADAFQTHGDIAEMNLDPAGATAGLDRAGRAVQSLKLTAQVLYKYLRHAERGRLQYPGRAALVALDDVIVVLAESILALSELGTQLVQMRVDAAYMGLPGPGSVCRRHEPQLREHSDRLRVTEFLMTKILSVLRVGDESEAQRHRSQVQERVASLVDSDIVLSDRLEQMGDEYGARAMVAYDRLHEVGIRSRAMYGPSRDPAGEELPDYSATTAGDLSSHPVGVGCDGRTIFSGLDLADLPALSLVPLPIHAAELKNGRFYTPDYCASVDAALADIAEANMKRKNEPIMLALGLKKPAVSGEPGARGRNKPGQRRLSARLGIKS